MPMSGKSAFGFASLLTRDALDQESAAGRRHETPLAVFCFRTAWSLGVRISGPTCEGKVSAFDRC